MVDSYRIIEIAKDARDAGDTCYVVVEFLAAGVVVCTEDFKMPHLKETASMPVLDANGDYVLEDATKLTKKEIADAQAAFVAAIQGVTDPAIIAAAQVTHLDPIDAKLQKLKRQIVSVDVKAVVLGNIERHITTINAKGLTGNRRDKTIRPEHKAETGISQRADLKALVGVVAVKP